MGLVTARTVLRRQPIPDTLLSRSQKLRDVVYYDSKDALNKFYDICAFILGTENFKDAARYRTAILICLYRIYGNLFTITMYDPE